MGAKPATRSTGAMGESICATYMRKLGYTVLRQNWYCRWGEIDIIAKKAGELVFIEVKTITAVNYCTPQELFNPTKRRRLLRTIEYFVLCQKRNIKNWRLDLVCITKDGRRVWLEHYKNVLAL